MAAPAVTKVKESSRPLVVAMCSVLAQSVILRFSVLRHPQASSPQLRRHHHFPLVVAVRPQAVWPQ